MRTWPEMQYVPKDQLAQWVESKKKLIAGATPAGACAVPGGPRRV